jgi:transcriptional regulator with XRE-family HTH domain
MAIGPRVRERRKELGFTQEQLASQTGVTLSAVQRLEGGRITDPHYSTLLSIANALHTTVAELVGEESEAPAPGNASAPRGQPEAEASQESGVTHHRRTQHDSVAVSDEAKAVIFGHLDELEKALEASGLNGKLVDMVDQMREELKEAA